MNRRTQRVAHVIRDIIAEAMREKLSDPRIEPFTSITRVEVSPDFTSAHIHVSVMADETHRKLTVVALQHSAGRLRSLIAQKLTMRTVPWLTFHLDESIRRSYETVQTIDRLMEELGPVETSATGGDATAANPPADLTPIPHVASPDERNDFTTREDS